MKKILIILLILFIYSCEEDIKQGIVIDKKYEKDNYQTIIIYNASLKLPTQSLIYDDEDYVLIIKGFNGKDSVEKRIEVDYNFYKNIDTGDIIILE